MYEHHDEWTMYFDGSLMLKGSGAGVVLIHYLLIIAFH